MSAMSRDWDRRSVLRAAGGIAALGGLAGLTGCGSNNGRGGGGSGSGPALSQWYHQYGEAGTLQAAKRYAKAYTKADVSIQWIPGTGYPDKLASGLLSSSGPDVFEFHPNVAMVQAKQVVPLDDIIADAKSDFTDQDLKANSWDGKVYGIRMIDDPQFLYYRKSLLAQANVTPPTTLAELIDAAHKLTTGKVKGLYLGLKSDTVAQPLIWSTGQDLLTADHKVGFASDDTVEALKLLRELYKSGSLLQGPPTDYWDPSSIDQGLCAMQFGGLWSMPVIQKTLNDDIGILPWPKSVGAKARQVVYNGGWSTYVSAKSKNIDAAKEFVKWLWITNKAYQEDWCLSYGFHIPPRKSLAAKATKLQSGTAAEAVKIFNENGIYDDPAFTPAMQTALFDAVSNVAVSGKDPKAQLDTAVSRIDTELKKLFG
jgi:multiple sugar transport system substrate-binding protein